MLVVVWIISMYLKGNVFMEKQLTLSKKAAQEMANAIIKEYNTILASERDHEILFDAIVTPPGPNKKLCDAAERYKLSMREGK